MVFETRAGADVPTRERKGITTNPAQNARVGGAVQAAAVDQKPNPISDPAAISGAIRACAAIGAFGDHRASKDSFDLLSRSDIDHFACVGVGGGASGVAVVLLVGG